MTDIFIAAGPARKIDASISLGVEQADVIDFFYVKSRDFGRVYGYLDRNLNYNSTILNESIATPDFEEFVTFMKERA